MPIVQEWQAERQRQQVEEVVVSCQDNEHLKQNLWWQDQEQNKIMQAGALRRIFNLLPKSVDFKIKCPSIWGKEQRATRNLANLHVKSSESQPAEGAEEKWRHHYLNDEGAHHTQLLPPHWQLMGEPGQRRGDALGLVVVGERCRDMTCW